jgi:hypothetical protein
MCYTSVHNMRKTNFVIKISTQYFL